MDRLPYIDLPQSTFNSSSTSRFDIPRTFVQTLNNSFEFALAVTMRKGASPSSFVNAATGSFSSVTIPTETQVGDAIFVAIYTQFTDTPSDFSLLLSQNDGRVGIFFKFAQPGDAGRSVTFGGAGESQDSYVSAVLVYRNIASVSGQNAETISASQVAFSATSLSDSHLNLYFAIGQKSGVATGGTSEWTTQGITQRITDQGTAAIGDTNKTIFAGDAFSTETVIPGGTETNIGGDPSSGFTRLRAKHDGTFQVRNSAGAETKVGGTVSVVSRVLSAAQAHAGGTTNVSGLSISIPAGKTATIILCAPIRETQTSTAGQYLRNVIINNPAGASGSVVGTFFAKAIDGTDATAGAIADGDVFSVAANASVTLSVSSGTTSGDVVQGWSEVITLSNTSTTTAATVTPSITSGASQQSTVPIGSSIFAIIT